MLEGKTTDDKLFSWIFTWKMPVNIFVKRQSVKFDGKKNQLYFSSSKNIGTFKIKKTRLIVFSLKGFAQKYWTKKVSKMDSSLYGGYYKLSFWFQTVLWLIFWNTFFYKKKWGRKDQILRFKVRLLKVAFITITEPTDDSMLLALFQRSIIITT